MADPLRLNTGSKLFWVILFSAAMAYIEAAVVVYLRLLYYPQGFDFPLAAAPFGAILIELGREAATIVMLTSIGMFCGRSRIERFAYLMLSFGIWDILYYVWLKVVIGWPASLLTWDILFLIPLPWVGPVLAPLLISLAMMGAALVIIWRQERNFPLQFPRWAWWAEILAGLTMIASFLWDVKNIATGGYPKPFHWEIFLVGLLGGIALFAWRLLKDEGRRT